MSRLIKSGWTNLEDQKNKVISIKRFKEEREEIEEPFYSNTFAEETEEIIRQAKEQAEYIISEANSYRASVEAQLNMERQNWEIELANLKDEAKQSGFEAGLQEGRFQGYSEVNEMIEEARLMVEASKEDYRIKIEASEHTILNIGLKVAEKILSEHLSEKPEKFIGVVKRALKEARDYREVQLHVNPIYYGFLLSQKEDLVQIFPKETELYIYPDSDLSEQSCVIESANGRIDASVDQQLEEIKRVLFEMLESE